MGSCEKKSRGERLARLEEQVLEAIESDEIKDKALDALVEIIIFSDAHGKPIFEKPLEEPLFFRQHFLPWVREGLRIRKEIDQASDLDIFKGEA